MATYGVDYGISSSHHRGDQTSNDFGEGDDDLLSTYSMLSPTCFTNMPSFKKCVIDFYNGFVVGSNVHHQYMAFTNVTRKSFDKIDAVREHRQMPKINVLYDATEEVLILKIISSRLHSAAVIQFHRVFYNKFVQLGVQKKIYHVESDRFGEARARCKEADNAYIPRERHYEYFPSLVVEVGVSESLQMLKNDARHWLTNTSGQTRTVIILHIDELSRKIVLQRWECVDDVRQRRATIEYPPLPRVIQSLELEADHEYVGDALEIPAIKVFDIVPNDLPNGEFVFTRNELQDFSEIFWLGA